MYELKIYRGPIIVISIMIGLVVVLFMVINRYGTPVPAADDEITQERQNYLGTLLLRGDLSIEQIEKLMDQYDDAHRSHPLSDEQKQARDELNAKFKSMNIKDCADYMRREYGMAGSDQELCDAYNRLADDPEHFPYPKVERDMSPGEKEKVKEEVNRWYRDHHLKDDGTPEN